MWTDKPSPRRTAAACDRPPGVTAVEPRVHDGTMLPQLDALTSKLRTPVVGRETGE